MKKSKQIENNRYKKYSKRIVALLTEGKVLQIPTKIVFLLMLIFGVIIYAGFVVSIIVSIILKEANSAEFLLINGCLIFCSIMLVAPSLIILDANNKKVKYMKSFIADAVLLKANARTYDLIETFVCGVTRNCAAKIAVYFKFENKTVCRCSGCGKNEKAAYQNVYLNYTDRDIEILYCKDVDEVIILKEDDCDQCIDSDFQA